MPAALLEIEKTITAAADATAADAATSPIADAVVVVAAAVAVADETSKSPISFWAVVMRSNDQLYFILSWPS